MQFSVIIPCYNNTNTLSRAVLSAALQPQCKEVIVIDDGSSKPINTIVENLQTHCACPIHFIQQPNQGPGAARNQGIKKAEQDWLLFLDADDELLDDALLHFANTIEASPDADWVLGGYCAIHPNKQKHNFPIQPAKTAFDRLHDFLWGKLKISQGTMAVKRKLAEQVLFPESIRNHEDTVFYSHCVTQGHGISLNKIVVNIYHSKHSQRHQTDSALQAGDSLADLIFDPEKLHSNCIMLRKPYEAKLLLSLSKVAANTKQKSLAKDYLRQALQLDKSLYFSPKVWKLFFRLT